VYSAEHFCPVLKKFDFLNRFDENPVGAILIYIWTDGWLDSHDEDKKRICDLSNTPKNGQLYITNKNSV
jgi:hypothetical protein